MEKGRAWIGRDADVSRAGWMVYVKAAGRREEVQVQKQVPPSGTGAGGRGVRPAQRAATPDPSGSQRAPTRPFQAVLQLTESPDYAIPGSSP